MSDWQTVQAAPWNWLTVSATWRARPASPPRSLRLCLSAWHLVRLEDAGQAHTGPSGSVWPTSTQTGPGFARQLREAAHRAVMSRDRSAQSIPPSGKGILGMRTEAFMPDVRTGAAPGQSSSAARPELRVVQAASDHGKPGCQNREADSKRARVTRAEETYRMFQGHTAQRLLALFALGWLLLDFRCSRCGTATSPSSASRCCRWRSSASGRC